MNNGSVVGILYQNGKFLAERRKADEKFYPNGVLFPGGAINDGETFEAALHREMKEELGIDIVAYSFLGHFKHDDGHKIAAFMITQWNGVPQALEAAEVFWIENEDGLTDAKNREMYRAAIGTLPH
jgi:8-oxo-dGTP diphosphatase